MTYKPGALVMLLKADSPPCAPLVGTFQTLLERDTVPKYWVLDGAFVGFMRGVAWHEDDMKVIDPGQGDEEFVVKSRLSLPRKKPVTGPVTIDVNGRVKESI